MKFIDFESFCRKEQLKIFTISDLKVLFHKYSPEYLRLKIARWKKQGNLKAIKKGLYTFPDAQIDEFEIASYLIIPSYISLESALSHYSIIPDVASTVSSVTTKNTRKFQIENIRYDFFHIKETLFIDYIHLRDSVFIATPEKALIDYFYFRNPTKDDQIFERLNPEILKTIRKKHMQKLAKKFPQYVQNITHKFCHAIDE